MHLRHAWMAVLLCACSNDDAAGTAPDSSVGADVATDTRPGLDAVTTDGSRDSSLADSSVVDSLVGDSSLGDTAPDGEPDTAPVDTGPVFDVVTGDACASGSCAKVKKVVMGEGGCVLLDEGTVKCWGFNKLGGVGDGTTIDRSTPVTVLTGAIDICRGAITCAVMTGGTVKCWGSNASNGLLLGTGVTISPTPVDLAGITGAQSVSCNGSYGGCAILTDRTVRCWGEDSQGERGDGPGDSTASPPTVVPLTDVVQVSTELSHSCALTASGAVHCWGRNGDGSVSGDGVKSTPVPSPVKVLDDAAQIQALFYSSAARMKDGTVKFWGWPLGSSSTAAGAVATVPGLAGVVDLQANRSGLCARFADAKVDCWGSNNYGQLGLGFVSATGFTSPMHTGLTHVTAIAGPGHALCVLLDSGALACLGDNEYGQVGDGTTIDRLFPTPVAW
jgi:alpha-tubulin suppressor-like RCC1 family protein